MSENDSEEIIEKKIGYSNEEELRSEFKEYLKIPVNRETAINYLYNSLVDEVIFGIVIEVHRSYKCNTFNIDDDPEDIEDYSIIEMPQSATNKKSGDLTFRCTNCGRIVTSSKFAAHLQTCMGMGRISSRIANRRITSKEDNDSFFSSNVSDEEDEDWAGEKRKKKSSQNVKSNRSKKNDISS